MTASDQSTVIHGGTAATMDTARPDARSDSRCVACDKWDVDAPVSGVWSPVAQKDLARHGTGNYRGFASLGTELR